MVGSSNVGVGGSGVGGFGVFFVGFGVFVFVGSEGGGGGGGGGFVAVGGGGWVGGTAVGVRVRVAGGRVAITELRVAVRVTVGVKVLVSVGVSVEVGVASSVAVISMDVDFVAAEVGLAPDDWVAMTVPAPAVRLGVSVAAASPPGRDWVGELTRTEGAGANSTEPLRAK